MQSFLQPPNCAHLAPKFPKSTSCCSLATQPEFLFEKEFSSRKVSEGQKLKLISLVTAEHLTMKTVTLLSLRPQRSSRSATALPKRCSPSSGTTSARQPGPRPTLSSRKYGPPTGTPPRLF